MIPPCEMGSAHVMLITPCRGWKGNGASGAKLGADNARESSVHSIGGRWRVGDSRVNDVPSWG